MSESGPTEVTSTEERAILEVAEEAIWGLRFLRGLVFMLAGLSGSTIWLLAKSG